MFKDIIQQTQEGIVSVNRSLSMHEISIYIRKSFGSELTAKNTPGIWGKTRP